MLDIIIESLQNEQINVRQGVRKSLVVEEWRMAEHKNQEKGQDGRQGGRRTGREDREGGIRKSGGKEPR